MRLQAVVKRLLLSSAMEVAVSSHDLSLHLGLSLQTLLSLCASKATFSPALQLKLDYFVACCSTCTASLAVATAIDVADLQVENKAPPLCPLFNSQIVSLPTVFSWCLLVFSWRILSIWAGVVKKQFVVSVFGFQRGQSGCAETRSVAFLDMVVSLLGTSQS